MSKPSHRILAERPCACGCERIVTVTTRRPTQRFYAQQCLQDLRARQMGARRARSVEDFRRSRFGPWIAARAKDGKLTEQALLECLMEAYTLGYRSGYRRAVKAKAPQQEAA